MSYKKDTNNVWENYINDAGWWWILSIVLKILKNAIQKKNICVTQLGQPEIEYETKCNYYGVQFKLPRKICYLQITGAWQV